MRAAEPSPSRRPFVRRTADAVAQEVRAAWRAVVKRPAFAALAVTTLALGIGANTAAFSMLYGVVLSRLPYPEPERLVRVWEVSHRGGEMSVAEANFRDWQDRAESFEALAAYQWGNATVLGADRPALVDTAAISRDFFRVFAATPAAGRLTTAEEHALGADPAAVVSHRFWRGPLGGAPLDGLTLDVAGFDVRIVGVLSPDFDFPHDVDLWYPMELFEPNPHRTAHNWKVVGRLRDGVPLERADTELDTTTRAAIEAYEGPDAAMNDYLAAEIRVVPLLEDLAGPVRKPLFLLLGAAVLVLLVACSNLASAFLARGVERQREMAVRVSLGAGPGRLLRQLFSESLLVAVAGAAAGLGLAWLVLRSLVASPGAAGIPRLDAVGLHGPVLAFTLAVSVATALLFGVLPGLQLVRRSPSRPLHTGGGGRSADRGRRRAWRALVAAEVALGLVLLAGSGLLLRSLWEVLRQDPGFDPTRVTAVSVSLPGSHYPEDPDRRRFFDDLLANLQARPEVERAGVTSWIPLGDGGSSGEIDLEGAVVPSLNAQYQVADSGYFDTLGIPLLSGRAFDTRDHAEAPHVAMVNRSLAEAAWPGESPIGKQVTGGGMDNFWDQDRWATVIGVVGDVRLQDLRQPDRPTVYFPYTQRPFRMRWGHVVARVAAGDERIAALLDDAVRKADPQVPYELEPLTDVVAGSVSRERFSAALLGGFALVGLLLAVVGVYGVVSYTVAQRRRELGIRLALGATPPRVRNHVLAGSMATVGVGIVLGLAASVAAGRLLQSLLYGVEPADPAVLASVSALLAATALGATWLPARETTRIDPVETLKAE